MQQLLAALKYLTFWGRLTLRPPEPEAIGGGAVFFPLVGLALGLLLALLNYWLAPYIDSEILSIALIAALIIATGGAHLDGLKQTFDADWAAAAVDSENSTLGSVAIILAILFKTGAADSMDEKLTLSLLLMPVLGRWALVVFIFGCQHRCEGAARRTAGNVKAWHLVIATAGTLALVAYLLGRKGLLISLFVSVFALLIRSLLYRRHALLNHANFGAVIELSEALGLILLASL
ncbi:MAG TPA: adenosylcobinamide-GDP ribazoletransferase [Methylomirabilota bacterium]|nr:adenosylcobinamide-GDP ribazoletransferase [Methylomirabilota bacterium]